MPSEISKKKIPPVLQVVYNQHLPDIILSEKLKCLSEKI